MKNVPNAQTSLPPMKVGGKPPTYVDLLRACLDFAPPNSGFTLDLMRRRSRVEKAIAKVKSGDEIKLEDQDYATAQEAIKAVVWVQRHEAYIAFADAFSC